MLTGGNSDGDSDNFPCGYAYDKATVVARVVVGGTVRLKALLQSQLLLRLHFKLRITVSV